MMTKVLTYCATFVIFSSGCFVAAGEEPAKSEAAPPRAVEVPLGENVRVRDPDNDPLTYKWVQLEGPSVKIADPNKLRTYFIPTAPGKYVFELQVSDGKTTARRSFTKIVTPPNRPPVVHAGPEKSAALGQLVQLTAEGEDPDGEPITDWEWRQTDGPKLKFAKDELIERQLRFLPKEAGLYVFEVRASDGRAWGEFARTAVSVKAPNTAPDIIIEGEETEKVELPVQPVPVKEEKEPVVVVGPDATIALGEVITLDGSGSYDPQGGELEFYWRQQKNEAPIIRDMRQDASSAKEGRRDMFACPRWFCTPTQPGKYVFVLEVTAGRRKASSRPLAFTVVEKNLPPIAEIRAAKTAWSVGETVRLDGSASRDPDGHKITFDWHWSKEGMYPKNFLVGKEHELIFTAEVPGDYGIELVVTDERGAQSKPAQISVKIAPANKPPVISVPPGVNGKVGVPCSITVTVEDPENDPTTVEWSVVEPKDLDLPPETLTRKMLVFTPAKPGLYVFRVKARETRQDGLESLSAQVQVAVESARNLPPTAVLRGPKEVDAGREVRLSGEASSDPEGRRLTYLWKQVGGPADVPARPGTDAATWTFMSKEPGDYAFSLQVSDGAHSSEPALWNVRVNRVNQPPIAHIARPEKIECFVGETFVLDGSGSRDPDPGTKLTYHWRLLEGVRAVLTGDNEPKVKVTPLAPGRLEVELVVNDGQTDGKPVAMSMLVLRRNLPPIAKITGPQSAEINKDVVLSGETSSDPDGAKDQPLETFNWEQVDNEAPQLDISRQNLRRSQLRFRAKQPGVYVFRLVVRDADGEKSAPAEWAVKVSPVIEPPFAKAFVVDRELGKPVKVGEEVRLSARDSHDPQGGKLTFEWRKREGPEILLPEDDGPELILKPTRPGRYVFEVVAANADRRSKPATVEFAVAGVNAKPVAQIADAGSVSVGGEVMLDATNSFDPDNDPIAEYRWRLVSAPPGVKTDLERERARARKFPYRLEQKGEYAFELTVFDGKDWSEPVGKTFVTAGVNEPPVARFKETDVKAETDAEVILSGESSYDPDRGPEKILRYIWDWPKQVRNPTEDGATFRFTAPSKPGVVRIGLTVFDGKDKSRREEVAVTVLEAGKLPVAIVAEDEIVTTLADKSKKYAWNDPEVVKLDGRHSTPSGKLRFQWRQIDDLPPLVDQPEELTKARFGMAVFTPGEYRFELRVQNVENELWSAPKIVRIHVKDPDKPRILGPEKTERTGGGEEENETRRAAENALRRAKTDEGNDKPTADIQAQIEKLSSAERDDRTDAALALLKIGDPCVPFLIDVLEEGKEPAADQAHKILRAIAKDRDEGKNAEKWRLWWNEKQREKNRSRNE
jgi:hypothetical protein